MTDVETGLRQQLLAAYIQNSTLQMQVQQLMAHVVKTLVRADRAIAEIPLIATNISNKKIDGQLDRLEKLKTDTVKALQLLISKGTVTQDELNEAL